MTSKLPASFKKELNKKQNTFEIPSVICSNSKYLITLNVDFLNIKTPIKILIDTSHEIHN